MFSDIEILLLLIKFILVFIHNFCIDKIVKVPNVTQAISIRDYCKNMIF